MSTEIRRRFGARVRELRQQQNLLQGELADKVGIRESFLSNIETAKKRAVPRSDQDAGRRLGRIAQKDVLGFVRVREAKKGPQRHALPSFSTRHTSVRWSSSLRYRSTSMEQRASVPVHTQISCNAA